MPSSNRVLRAATPNRMEIRVRDDGEELRLIASLVGVLDKAWLTKASIVIDGLAYQAVSTTVNLDTQTVVLEVKLEA